MVVAGYSVERKKDPPYFTTLTLTQDTYTLPGCRMGCGNVPHYLQRLTPSPTRKLGVASSRPVSKLRLDKNVPIFTRD